MSEHFKEQWPNVSVIDLSVQGGGLREPQRWVGKRSRWLYSRKGRVSGMVVVRSKRLQSELNASRLSDL